jgi:hypothetical protein
MEAAHQLFVEDGHLTIQDQHVGAELRDCGGELAETRGVIDGVARDQADAGSVLVGEDAPPVDLFLVDPAVTMEGRTNERRGHGSQRNGNDYHRDEVSRSGQSPRAVSRADGVRPLPCRG